MNVSFACAGCGTMLDADVVIEQPPESATNCGAVWSVAQTVRCDCGNYYDPSWFDTNTPFDDEVQCRAVEGDA